MIFYNFLKYMPKYIFYRYQNLLNQKVRFFYFKPPLLWTIRPCSSSNGIPGNSPFKNIWIFLGAPLRILLDQPWAAILRSKLRKPQKRSLYTPIVQGPQVKNQITTGVFTEITSLGSPECIPVEI